MHGLSAQECRRSQLTFISSQEPTQTIDFRDLKRAGEPVSRSKSGVQGKIADVFRSRSRHAESQNELRGFRILLASGQVDEWQEQPFLLEYHHGGIKHRYTPDVLVLDRDDYDPSKHAVVLLSTFREIVHKWIVDVYLQTPHRGIQDLPAHRWCAETSGLPPPLPPSAGALDTVLGMTTERVVFHYGVELEGLKYNSCELGELRRRTGANLRVALTFDPGDLGHINVLDPRQGSYIRVPALNQAYASRLSLWQHKVIRRYTQRHLDGRTDILALAQAKAEIRALVDRDFHRKSTRSRKRHARFLSEPAPNPPATQAPENSTAEPAAREQQSVFADVPSAARPDFFNDDDVLPVFEANLDLPHQSTIAEGSGREASTPEEA